MKIAILGAGYAGLSLAWHLLHESQFSVIVDLFDPFPIGGGVSGYSSGLLHPFAGQQAKKSWEADQGMNATHELITGAASALAQPIVLSHGILRPAWNEKTLLDFQMAAEKYPEQIQWWAHSTCIQKIPSLQFGDLKEGGAIYIKDGLTIHTKLYLEGLWQAAAKGGATHIKKAVSSPDEIARYDTVVFCLGAHSLEHLNLPITLIKGQRLKLKWPIDLPPLPCSLIGKGYLVMNQDLHFCYAGATFEKNFNSEKPDQNLAKQLIMEKILPIFPSLEQGQIIDCVAGVRATTPRHLPIVDQIDENHWVYTALGSKGLLWHAFLGKKLAKAILQENPSLIPSEVRISAHE